jgi:hypothetical protein
VARNELWRSFVPTVDAGQAGHTSWIGSIRTMTFRDTRWRVRMETAVIGPGTE